MCSAARTRMRRSALRAPTTLTCVGPRSQQIALHDSYPSISKKVSTKKGARGQKSDKKAGTFELSLRLCSRGGSMRTLLCLLLLATLAGVAIANVDVTGRWAGTFNVTDPTGETKESTALLVLKQTGADISGTVGPNEDEQFRIEKGKIEGNKIMLEADHDGNPIKFDLVLAGDRITGEANGSHEGQTLKAHLDVTRAK
jgi:hypothetical protein